MRYIGSFQGVGAKRNLVASKKNSHILKVCLFLGMGRDSNNSLLQDFSEFAQSNNIEITVKLHPRDRQRYSSVFPQATYVNSYKEDFSEFSKAFDLAVTFPSGIISDLLYTELPFLVYVPPRKEYQGAEAEYLPDGMETVVCFSNLSKKIKNIDKLVREHENILKNFRKANGIVTNIKSIELNLDNLTTEKRLMHEGEFLRKDLL
jgi:CDP-glycerol glycerophosphotransferase (TagB/SpsB family)